MRRRTVRTWRVGYIHPVGGGEAGFVVALHRFVVWRWVLARLCERLLPCGCCVHDWPWRVGWGVRDGDGDPRYSLGRGWHHVRELLSALERPIGAVQVRLSPEEAEQLAPGVVGRAARRGLPDG